MDDRDTIQARMLANISDEYDKSEGSFFYDSIMPVAIELESVYKEQKFILDKGFVETTTGAYLDLKVAEQGIIRKPATKATTTVMITGIEGATIKAGDLVASETVNFVIKETKTIDETGIVEAIVECEQAGSIGNVPVETIKYFPITIPGINSVINNQAVTNGYNSETDDELRQRYYDKVRAPSTSGNKYHYRNWALEVSGVGDAKVFPLWNDVPGTVRVVIINSNKKAADESLVSNVESYIEEERPIGATVTVISGSEVQIDVTVHLVLANGFSSSTVQDLLESALINYFKDIAFVESYVSYAKIGSIILALPGVGDYSNLLVNGDINNVLLGDEEVPVLGTVSLEV